MGIVAAAGCMHGNGWSACEENRWLLVGGEVVSKARLVHGNLDRRSATLLRAIRWYSTRKAAYCQMKSGVSVADVSSSLPCCTGSIWWGRRDHGTAFI